jgi:hypothetical protein
VIGVGLRHASVRGAGLRAALLAPLLLAVAGCGGGGHRRAQDATGRCIEGWNASENSGNRDLIASLARYHVVAVVPFSFRRTGGQGGNTTVRGCSFYFHGQFTYLRLAGEWHANRLTWIRALTISGTWDAPHRRRARDSADVKDDGALEPLKR